MRHRWIFSLLALLAASTALPAQSNELMDELLAEEQATAGKTAYLVLHAAGLISGDASPESSLVVLQEKEWGIESRGAEAPIKMGEFSHLLMRALEIPGGLMYRIFPGPRYAARELAYLGITEGKTSPYRYPSGEEVVRVLGRALDWKEAGR